MGARVYSPTMVWQPIPSGEGISIMLTLDRTLREWDRTPYESGQCFKQRGADCIGGVFGPIDEMDGQGRAQRPNMPHDGSLHNRKAAVAALRELVTRYSPCRKLESEDDGSFFVEPGDIVVTGMPGGGPGHVEIVGANRNELWHALPMAGFHQGGWSFLTEQVLWAVYRIEDKWRWANV